MSKDFKVGDLALIINDSHAPHIGMVVELRFAVTNGEEYEPPFGLNSRNRSGEDVWIVVAKGLRTCRDGVRVMEGWTQKAERNLMPLRGDFAPEQQKAKEAEPCA